MLLVLSISAFAADPPLPAVASSMELEVDMPAVNIVASPGGASPWRRLPDGMGAELALALHGIDVEDASVVSVEQRDGRTRIDWTELNTGDVRMRVEKASATTVCTASVAGRIWSGSGAVAVYAPTAGREDAVSHDLGFMIVEDHPSIGALVALAPGDSVTVTNARRKGTLIHEWVEVTRASGSVTVDRTPSGERICTTASNRAMPGE